MAQKSIYVSWQVLYSQSVVDDYMWLRNLAMSPVKFCTASTRELLCLRLQVCLWTALVPSTAFIASWAVLVIVGGSLLGTALVELK